MINNVTLVGRLVGDPELRFTSQGVAVAQFRLAVNRNYTNQNGEREADFISCVVWRKPAETLANYARKGSLLGVTGRIQTRNFENQQGQKVYVTEVVVEEFQLLESKEVTQSRRQARYGQQGNTQPAAPAQPGNMDANYPLGGHEMNISDDDMPF